MRRMTDRAARGRNRQRTRRRAKTFREPTAICEIQSNSPQSDVCRDAPSHTNDEMGISRVGHSGQGERTAHKRTHRNRHSRNMPNKRFQATPAPRTCCGPPSCRGCTKATVLKTPSMVTMRLPRKARQNHPLPIVLERIGYCHRVVSPQLGEPSTVCVPLSRCPRWPPSVGLRVRVRRGELRWS
jgi:hypothetical protein